MARTLTDLEKHVLAVLDISEEQYEKDSIDQMKTSLTRNDLEAIGQTMVVTLQNDNDLGLLISGLFAEVEMLKLKIANLEGGK